MDAQAPHGNAPDGNAPDVAWDASVWDARYREAREAPGARLWSARPARIVADTVSAWQPGRALDLATGDGRTAIWLATQGWSVTGVDFSAEAIELARTHAADEGVEVDWLVADAVSWEPEERFDLVTVMYLQLPKADLRRVLARVAGWVAPGGHLLVVGHDRANIATGAPGPANPDVLYTPELLRSAIAAGDGAVDGAVRVLRCETVRRDLATDPEGPDDARAAAHGTESHGTGAGAAYALDTVLVASAWVYPA